MKMWLKLLLCAAGCAALLIVLNYGIAACKLLFPRAAEPEADKIRVACVGDSITFGSHAPFAKEKSFPVELQKLLGDNYQVLNFGLSGRTLVNSGNHPYRNEKFFLLSQEAEPSVVLMMLGSNDSRPYNWDATAYEKELEEMVLLYKNLPGAPKVYLMTPPAAFVAEGKTKVVYDIRAEVIRDEIRPIVLRVGERTDTPVIDLYAATENHPEWFSDGVHPNDEGNRRFAEYIYRYINNAAAPAGEVLR